MDSLPNTGNIADFTGRVWHSDCLELLAALPDKSVDLILTDPPYGNNNGVTDLAGSRARDKVKGGRSRGVIEAIANDDLPAWSSLIPEFFIAAHRVIKTNGAIACFVGGGGGKQTHFAKAILWLEEYAEFFHALVWDKSARGYGLGWRYRRNYEMVLIAGKKNGRIGWGECREAQPNVVYFPPTDNLLHPTQKPSDLLEWLIENHTNPNDIVLDPFCGSATTAIACLNLDRQYICGDSHLPYVELSRQRIASHDPFVDTPLKNGLVQKSLFASTEGEGA